MKVTIQPSKLSGRIKAPASKSSMQRACAAALIRNGKSKIIHPGHSNDDKAALDIVQKLGAVISNSDEALVVESKGVFPIKDEINCGESGLSIRMFTPIVAGTDKKIKITGSGSLLTRPMDHFDEILPLLGVKINSNEGKLPLFVQGPLKPANIEVDGSLSSQFLTGLLMAFSAAYNKGNDESLPGEVTITVNNLKSRPYIDLTLDVLKRFSLPCPVNKDYKAFTFTKQDQPNQDLVEYVVEADWSGAAFLLVAGVIAGPIKVSGLDFTSTQGDRKILDALHSANASVAVDAKGIQLRPNALTGFSFDATDCPDLFPPLVALAAYCKGTSRIKGVQRLTHKESDRAKTLQEEFATLNIKIEIAGDEMIVHGGKVSGGTVHSRHDHRIAMACAIAALGASGTTIIEDAQAVKKSYPDFFSDLKSLGANVSLPYLSIT